MSHPHLRAEIERFDPELAIEAAWTPPASWYVDPAFLELEGEKLFSGGWIQAGRAEQVREPGAFCAGSLLGQHHVVVRDQTGELRAFHNVCRHHAAKIATGAGRCEQLVCPYHGWTYALDGRLSRAPRSGGIEGFDRADFGLVPLRVEEWGPLVFVHGGTDPRPLREDLAGLDWLRDDIGPLRFAARREYRLRCNWKVFVDNYLDGGYHVPVLHRGLGAQLDLSSYRTGVFGRYSVQSCGGGSGDEADGGERTDGGGAAPAEDFADRIGRRAFYVFVYPNLMINRYGPMMDTNLVVPLSPSETLVVFDYFFDESRADDERFVERSLLASDRVQEEDRTVCESVQAGLESTAYDRGRYAPRVEIAEHHFHRLLAADLRS